MQEAVSNVPAFNRFPSMSLRTRAPFQSSQAGTGSTVQGSKFKENFGELAVLGFSNSATVALPTLDVQAKKRFGLSVLNYKRARGSLMKVCQVQLTTGPGRPETFGYLLVR